jgi:hypothetical protein
MKNIESRLQKLEEAIKPLSPELKEDPSLTLFKKYSKAIVHLLGESCYIHEAGKAGKPWFPKDPEKYFWARSELEKYLSEGGDMFVEDDVWPSIGEIPAIKEEELTEERKEEIRRQVREWRKPGAGVVCKILADLAVGVYFGRVEGLTLRGEV